MAISQALKRSNKRIRVDNILTKTYEKLKTATTSFTVTLASGAANVCTVTITAKDAAGTTCAEPVLFWFWVSSAATGIGVTTHSPDSTIVATTGAVFGVLTAHDVALCQTSAAGVCVLSITDATHKTQNQYMCVAPLINPTTPIISAATITANYG
jgi:hypothetical protein